MHFFGCLQRYGYPCLQVFFQAPRSSLLAALCVPQVSSYTFVSVYKIRKNSHTCNCKAVFFQYKIAFSVYLDTAAKTSQPVIWIVYHVTYHTCNITPFQSPADSSLLERRQAKSSIVQHHCINDKTSRFFSQKLDAITVLVDEDENIPVTQVCRHTIIHNTTEHMETLAHICRFCEEPVSHAIIQAEHN